MTTQPNLVLEQAPEAPAETPAAPLSFDDLFVQMGRQNCEYFTTPSWPSLADQKMETAYIVRASGLWERRRNDAGWFLVHKGICNPPLIGFPMEEVAEGFILEHDKIPYELLQEILFFFKSICDDSGDEVYVQIFWSLEDQIVDGKHVPANTYFSHCPTQEVSGSSVNFQRNVELEAKNVLVFEIHSHNKMGAFFSATDDKDEKRDRLFAVVGKLDTVRPEMKFSFVCGGKRVLVKQEDIFTEPLVDPFPKGWRGNVTKRGTTTHSSSSTSSSSGWEAQKKENYHRTGPTAGTSIPSATTSRHAMDVDDFQDRRLATVSGPTKTAAEIRAEVTKATTAALGEIDTVLKSHDFMKERNAQTVASINAEVLARAGIQSQPTSGPVLNKTSEHTMEPGVSTTRPFFRQGATGADQQNAEHDRHLDNWRREQEKQEWDAQLEHVIQEIERHFLNQKFLDEQMTDDDKSALFQDLMAYLEPTDIALLAQTMADMGYEDHLQAAIEIAADFDDTEHTITTEAVDKSL